MLVAERRLAYCVEAQDASLGVAERRRDVAVGGEAEQGLEVVGGPVALGVDVVGGLHRPQRPVRSAAMACAASSMLGSAASSAPGGEILLDERLVTGLEQVDGPGNGEGPETVHVLALCPDDSACLGEQRVRVAVKEPCVNRLVRIPTTSWLYSLSIAVDAGVEVVAAARDLRRDEAALVGVDERRLGHVDLGDAGQLRIPEGAHVREVRSRIRQPPARASLLGHGSALPNRSETTT